MAIDIKNLIEFAQGDINSIDSTGDTQRILELAKFARRQAQTTLHMYDSTSDLPNLLDDVADTAQLAYVRNRREVYFNDGSWKPMTQSAPVLPSPYTFQGSNFGYTSGGAFPRINVIDKFPFASDTNASDVGDLTIGKEQGAEQSSQVSGYASGGYSGIPTPGVEIGIDKFPFATDANATNVGDLSVEKYGNGGNSSEDNGYASGGSPITANIDKFPFASDGTATGTSRLGQARMFGTGQSSSETGYGYLSGGQIPTVPTVYVNIIEKFSFPADTSATDVGDLTLARRFVSGTSSSTHGYTSGGFSGVSQNVIDKFPFSSDANATDVGDLLAVANSICGISSTSSGYGAGGNAPSYSNVIQKFSFTSDGNATDVGDLTVARRFGMGQQY